MLQVGTGRSCMEVENLETQALAPPFFFGDLEKVKKKVGIRNDIF